VRPEAVRAGRCFNVGGRGHRGVSIPPWPPDNRHPWTSLPFAVDFILHVDLHLTQFVQAYGAWVLCFVVLHPFSSRPVSSSCLFCGRFIAVRGGGAVRPGPDEPTAHAGAAGGRRGARHRATTPSVATSGPRVFGWEQSRFSQARVRSHACLLRALGGFTLIAAASCPSSAPSRLSSPAWPR